MGIFTDPPCFRAVCGLFSGSFVFFQALLVFFGLFFFQTFKSDFPATSSFYRVLKNLVEAERFRILVPLEII